MSEYFPFGYLTEVENVEEIAFQCTGKTACQLISYDFQYFSHDTVSWKTELYKQKETSA
jgi:hypothetical protein